MTHQNLRLGKYWKLFWATSSYYLMQSPMRKVARFQCLSCQLTFMWGQWIFPTCWILIGKFKFPARQPYARVERNVFFRGSWKGEEAIPIPFPSPYCLPSKYDPTNTQNPRHSCLQEICHPTFKSLYFSSIILRAWLEGSFSVFSQERCVRLLLFTVT